MTLRRFMVWVGALVAAGAVVHALVRLPAVATPRLWVDRVTLLASDGVLFVIGVLVLVVGTRVRRGLTAEVRYQFGRHPRAVAVTLGLVLAGVALAAVEEGVALVDSRKPHPQEVQRGTFTTEFFVDDPVLGYGAARNARVTSIKEVDGVEVYNVVYTTDEAGRRVTPPPVEGDGPLVLFFGCSNTFGEGVQDSETLPSCVARLATSARVYNYGFCGYGPQQMLAMIQDGRLDDVVRGRDVIAVYLFIDAHVARAVGSMIVTTTWGIDMPFYTMTSAGELERRGSFRTGRSWQNWFYALASRNRTLAAFRGDLPPLRSSHFALTAKIITEASRELRSRSHSTRFYVVMHPHVLAESRLVPCFDGSDVHVLDYVGLYGRSDPDYMIPNDWHPTPLAYRTLASAIVRDVGLGDHGHSPEP